MCSGGLVWLLIVNFKKGDKMSMKAIQRTLFVIVLLFLGYIVGTVSTSYSTATNKFEYKVVIPTSPVPPEPNNLKMFEEDLNKMTAQGWELSQYSGCKNIAIFVKR